jgi:predicted nucleic acid-binding protein
MILADSSVWIDYFNGVESWHTDSLDNHLSKQIVLIGDIIITEVLQGFRSDYDYRQACDVIEGLVCVQLIGKPLAIKAADNFRSLRSKGITIRKTIDMLIATWCIEYQIELLHNDKDFQRMTPHLPLQTVS